MKIHEPVCKDESEEVNHESDSESGPKNEDSSSDTSSLDNHQKVNRKISVEYKDTSSKKESGP